MNESKPPAREGWRPTGRQIIAAVLVVAVLVFVFQNGRTGHFNFLWLDFRGPVWLWLFVVFGAGVGTGLLVAGRRAKRKGGA